MRISKLIRKFRGAMGLGDPVTPSDKGTGPTRRDLATLALAGAFVGSGSAEVLAGSTPAGFAALSPVERETLVRGLAGLSDLRDAALEGQAAAVLSEISANFPEAEALYDLHRLYRLRGNRGGAWRPEASVDMSVLADATAQSRPLWIRYGDLQGQMTERKIWPLALVYPDHGVFVLAWCCERQAFRQFFAHAIEELRELDGDFSDRRLGLLRGMLEEQGGGTLPKRVLV